MINIQYRSLLHHWKLDIRYWIFKKKLLRDNRSRIKVYRMFNDEYQSLLQNSIL